MNIHKRTNLIFLAIGIISQVCFAEERIIDTSYGDYDSEIIVSYKHYKDEIEEGNFLKVEDNYYTWYVPKESLPYIQRACKKYKEWLKIVNDNELSDFKKIIPYDDENQELTNGAYLECTTPYDYLKNAHLLFNFFCNEDGCCYLVMNFHMYYSDGPNNEVIIINEDSIDDFENTFSEDFYNKEKEVIEKKYKIIEELN